MTVKELIEKLQKIEDQNKTVTITVNEEETRYFDVNENEYFVKLLS